jgi:hypothetical protein
MAHTRTRADKLDKYGVIPEMIDRENGRDVAVEVLWEW